MPKLASDLGNTINKSRKALPNSNIRAFDEKYQQFLVLSN